MLRGMFDFEAVSDNTLQFKAKEQLLYLGTHELDKNWMKASNAYGRVALVPVNYVNLDQEYTCENLMGFLNTAIWNSQQKGFTELEDLVRLKDFFTASGDVSHQISKLEAEIKQRRQVAIAELSNVSKSYVPRSEGDYGRTNSDGPELKEQRARPKKYVDKSVTANSTIAKEVGHELLIRRINDVQSNSVREVSVDPYSDYSLEPTEYEFDMDAPNNGKKKPVKYTELTTHLSVGHPNECRHLGEIIDAVRNATGISHSKSETAVERVIMMLQTYYPELIPRFSSLVLFLEAPSSVVSRVPEIIEKSPDTYKLKELFEILSRCKDDEQQRNWALHEDELMIQEAVSDLHSILLGADASISKYVMRRNHYVGVDALALLYQMEVRKGIRSLLREVFITICKIDRDALSVLVNSILPMDLGREFQECCRSCDRLRLLEITKLLSILMCTGEALPITHYEYVGADLIRTVLRTIENPPIQDEETLRNDLVNFLLGYNLQFHSPEHNLTIQALWDIEAAPYLSQKLINLLNWGQDPLACDLPHGPPEMNSVFKMLLDIFACVRTAKLFYMNDVTVLIDIVVRWLTDLPPSEKRRILFLKLTRHILRNTTYHEYQHRKNDLYKCLTRILIEEDPSSVPSQLLVKDLYIEFPILSLN